LDREKARYLALRQKRQDLELANALAYESSRIEYLEAQGTPVYSPRQEQEILKEYFSKMGPPKVPVLCYEQAKDTKYPFMPKIHFEQMDHLKYESDPLFGRMIDPLGSDLYDWGLGNYGINSFPRELSTASQFSPYSDSR
jgi:hypothetical protein